MSSSPELRLPNGHTCLPKATTRRSSWRLSRAACHTEHFRTTRLLQPLSGQRANSSLRAKRQTTAESCFHRQSAPCLGRTAQLCGPPSLCRHRQGLATRALGPETLGSVLQTGMEYYQGFGAGALVNTVVYILGIKVLARGLSVMGIFHSWLLGTLTWSVFGLGGYAMVVAYFLTGSLVTKLKIKEKEKEGIAERGSGRRTPASVYGSGAAGMLCALGALYGDPGYALSFCKVGFAAAFASKAADTVSSEVGKAYGRRTFSIVSFQAVPRGTEGAVSLEGSAAGLAAAGAFTYLAMLLRMVHPLDAWAVFGAAVFANIWESWLGATQQGQDEEGWMNNDVVNVLQTCMGAFLAMLFSHGLARELLDRLYVFGALWVTSLMDYRA